MNERPEDETERREWPWPWIAGGLVALLVILVAYLSFGGGGKNEDRLSDTVVEREETTTPEQQCAAQSVHERIKRELFRRAAQARGSDTDAFASVARHASVRMEAPMPTLDADTAGTVSCTGLLWLDLPPGVTASGRRTLSGDLIYTVRRTSDGDLLLAGLGNAEAIISPLATLARAPTPEEEVLANEMTPVTDGVAQPQDGFEIVVPPGAQPDAGGSGPSYDCGDASTSSEVAGCNDAGLAAIAQLAPGERRGTAYGVFNALYGVAWFAGSVLLGALYDRSVASGNAQQRALLVRTRDRFLAYRDGCRTTGCIAGAYQGRMREIRDIMAGQWEAPR